MSQAMLLSCKSCDRAIQGAALACVACGALHHVSCYRGTNHCAACTCAKPAVAVSVGDRGRSRATALLAAGLAMFTLVIGIMVQGQSVPFGPPPTDGRTDTLLADPPVTRLTGRWTGTISGNDPRVTAEVDLSQVGREVSGLLRWNSPNSGRSHRRVAGHYDAERRMVILRDVEMPVQQANGPWHFCPVDYYLLELTGDELTGSYWSSACTDRARVRLRRTF